MKIVMDETLKQKMDETGNTDIVVETSQSSS